MKRVEYVIIGPEYDGEDDYCNVEIFRGTLKECREYHENNISNIYIQFPSVKVLRADKIPEGYILYKL
jgi:hypothetical protein